eukprot:4204773-Amphidinium_carterae.1
MEHALAPMISLFDVEPLLLRLPLRLPSKLGPRHAAARRLFVCTNRSDLPCCGQKHNALT